jgi:hypothetical protein
MWRLAFLDLIDVVSTLCEEFLMFKVLLIGNFSIMSMKAYVSKVTKTFYVPKWTGVAS